jgi:hypothetical protein
MITNIKLRRELLIELLIDIQKAFIICTFVHFKK